MSFAEKHKAWLLPVLALGIGGVVYSNLQTFGKSPSPPPPATLPQTAPESASRSAAAAPSPEPPAPVAPVPIAARPEAPVGGSNSDIWADLRPYAVVPDPLGNDQALEVLARNAIDSETVSVLGPVARPSHIREPKPQPKPGDRAEESAKAIPPPDVEFLVKGPSGSRAWFEGRPYQSGQILVGKPFTVGSIDQTSVVLKGPQGPTLQWTNPLHSSGPKAPTAPEAP